MTCVLLWMACGVAAVGQTPRVGYLYPPAIERDRPTELLVGGYDFTPDMQLFVLDPSAGIEQIGPLGDFHITPPPYWSGPRQFMSALPIPREIPARITVGKKTSLGLRRWQVANANGGSSMGVFLVSDIREIVEDRFYEEAQVVGPLPVGVSGRLSRIAETDTYALTAVKDGPMTIDCWGRRLGSEMNAAIQIEDARGTILVDEMDTEGRDLTVTFAASKGETYTLRIHDTDFRGARQFVYRLAIWDRPRVISCRPARLAGGKTQQVEFTGWGLMTGRPEIETIDARVTLGDDVANPVRYQLETALGPAMPLEIPLQTSSVEECRATAAESRHLKSNQSVTARLGPEDQPHEYTFQAEATGECRIVAESRAIGGDLDLALSLCHPDGSLLAENDDASGTVDAELRFQATEGGHYVIRVSGFAESSSANANWQYRLEVVEPPEGYQLTTGQIVQGKPGTTIEIQVNRIATGGFHQPIELLVRGLPDGVTVQGVPRIEADQENTKIVLSVADSVRVLATPIQIDGRAVFEKESDSATSPWRPVLAPATGNLCDLAGATTNQMLLVITMDAPFAIELIDKNRQRVVHRGTTYPAPFIVKRTTEYNGEIQLVMKAAQSRHRMGIRGPTVTVPPGVDRVLYPCFMPEWISTARTSRMEVLAMGQVEDPQGHPRYVTKSADARVTMICEGALLKVSHAVDELRICPGTSFQIPVQVLRNSKLQTAVDVELVLPNALEGLLVCSPVSLSREANEATLTVRTRRHPKLRGTFSMAIRASTLADDRWPVKSMAEFEVDFIDD